MINKLFIYEYINKLSLDDINKFSLNQGITLSNKELNIIYDYIKNRYKDIFNDPIKIINEIKDKVSNPVY